jgi:hypothetical protein
MMDTSITLAVEISEDIYLSLSTFLDTHSSWDFNEVFAIAISRFLSQESAALTVTPLIKQSTDLQTATQPCSILR